MAGLFKKKLLKQKLEGYTIPNFEEKIALIQQRHDAQKKGILSKKTETECEQAFNDDFFKKVLGYISFPSSPYTIDPKGKTQATAQKPDAILGYYTPEGENTHKNTQVVVEIKDATTPLDKSQRREGNLSPIQQGFKYKPQYSNCKRVIATNFIEIRLFKDNQLDYEIRTLEDIVDPSNDYYQFKRFYYLLNAGNLISKSGQSVTEKLLSEVRIEQEQITKKFYKEYKQLRLELINDMRKNNPESGLDLIIEKAQKVIDRLIFVHFCEDLELLPENKLAEVVAYAENLVGVPVWQILQGFFEAVNSGSTKLNIPDGYNGGLFHEDNVLNALKIGDGICRKFVDIGVYDFAEDLSVNILGHIFEQSISDLEELKIDLLGTELETGDLGESKGKISKRKKDGVFYTPEYIVDYIVKNSLGVRLEEQFETLKKKKFKQSKKMKDDTFQAKEKELYVAYQQILQNVKVLDPACGSGAFLVKVFDYLLAENQRVGEILGSLFDNETTYKSILQNNIYGVDLNAESVEITKLSLWLKTAEKGKKLADLDGNIKCGNSLIDDFEVAGDKAFKWEEEFEEIMSEGGFDVVVGNPPRGASLSKSEKLYLKNRFEIIDSSTPNTYTYFIGLATKLSKKIGIIIPDSYLIKDYEKTRTYLKYHTNKLVWHQNTSMPNELKPFEQVEHDVVSIFIDLNKEFSQIIYTLNKFESSSYQVLENVNPIDLICDSLYFNAYNLLAKPKELNLKNKFRDSKTINDIAQIHEGIHTGNIRKKLFVRNDNGDFSKKVFVGGRSGDFIDSYYSKRNSWYVNYNENYIDKSMGEYASLRNEKIFNLPKVYITRTGNPFKCFLDLDNYASNNFFSLQAKDYNKNSIELLSFFTCLFNSNFAQFYIRKIIAPRIGDTYIETKIVHLLMLPVLNINFEEKNLGFHKIQNIASIKRKELYNSTEIIIKFLMHRFNLESTSNKLQQFYELDFTEFKKQIKIKKISLEDEEELLSYFTKKQSELLLLKAQIDATDREIDEMVFDLYGLTDEEREIVLDG